MSRPVLDLITQDIWNKYFIPIYTAPKVVEIKKFYKISICTNSMDRLYTLQDVYIKNIEDNIDYPNIEWVLLNYGSKDNINSWAKEKLTPYIDRGLVNYYETTAKYYSMSHSRNITFRLATGDIVLNVDTDHFVNKGFATKVNELANQISEKVVFVKSGRRNRGRLGMFKKDFLSLGGYDEDMIGYGYDDKDLLMRAFHSGFKILYTGSNYCTMVKNHSPHASGRYQYSNWKYTESRNALLSLFNLSRGKLIANKGIRWGSAKVFKNFKYSEKIKI